MGSGVWVREYGLGLGLGGKGVRGYGLGLGGRGVWVRIEVFKNAAMVPFRS
jgi:hypothetical protein